MGGFVLLFRSLLDKGWASNPEYMATWVRLVLKASHADHEVFVNGENVKLERGQFFTGRKALAKEVGLSDSKVERILGFFKREGMLDWVSTNKGRLITIKNYDRFQGNFGVDTQGYTQGDTPTKTGQQNKQQTEQPQVAPNMALDLDGEQQNKQPIEQRANSKRTATEHKQRTERTKQGKEQKKKETAYAFDGRRIKLNQKDFDDCIATYPNLNIPEQLAQLDIELADEKKWWGVLHAKLNFRNGKARPRNHGRTPAENFSSSNYGNDKVNW